MSPLPPPVPPLRRGSAEHRSSSFPEARLPSNPKSTPRSPFRPLQPPCAALTPAAPPAQTSDPTRRCQAPHHRRARLCATVPDWAPNFSSRSSATTSVDRPSLRRISHLKNGRASFKASVHRRAPRSPHPPCPYPGAERRELPAETVKGAPSVRSPTRRSRSRQNISAS